MAELVLNVYLHLAHLFADLFPERFREAARTGPMWRRVVTALVIGLGSLATGLIVAALVLAALFLIAVVVFGIAKALI